MKKLWKSLYRYPLLWGFALLMGGLFLLDLCFTSNPYSELENRKLKQKPTFSLEALLTNRYTKEYEDYINDQFVGRDQWITLKSVFESALGKTENNGVVYGAEGYIFNKLLPAEFSESRSNGTGFGGDGTDTPKLPAVNTSQLNRNLGFLRTFRESYDGSVTAMIVPNSYGVLPELLPAHLPNVDQEAAVAELYRQMADMGRDMSPLPMVSSYPQTAPLGVNTVDCFGPLRRAAAEMQVCYRTDHHWTTDGAWVGYRTYCESRGLPFATLKELAPYRREEPGFLGTYYNKSKNFGVQADTLVWYDIPVEDVTVDGEHRALQSDGSYVEVTGLYQTEKLSTRDKYAAFLYGNNGMTVIRSGNNKGHKDGEVSRVLVIKDSYGNCFAPFLTYSYDEVWVADLRNMTFKVSETVAENQFDDVLILYNFDTFQEDRNFSRITY